MNPAAVAAIRRATLWATVVAFLALAWFTWLPTPWGDAPDWTCPQGQAVSGCTEVSAPLTRKLLFYHPASAWAAFAAYLVTFALSIAYLNERRLRDDTTARAAAEVGFLMNTIALATGTLWGVQEWFKSDRAALATVYTDPKVLVVLVLWLTFAAYLLLRRLVDGAERRARLAAVFGVLGFLGVPASFLVSKLVGTDLHPDDPKMTGYQHLIFYWAFAAFTLLFVHLFLARLRLARLEERLADLEDLETLHAE